MYDERLKQYFKDTAKLIARQPKSSEFLFQSDFSESFQFTNETQIMNTTMREQEQQIQSVRADIMSRLTAQPIVLAIAA